MHPWQHVCLRADSLGGGGGEGGIGRGWPVIIDQIFDNYALMVTDVASVNISYITNTQLGKINVFSRLFKPHELLSYLLLASL